MLWEELNQSLSETLTHHKIQESSEAALRIRAILYQNHRTGRIQRWLDYIDGRTIRDYCHEVTQLFLEMGTYIDRVRANDEETWASLDNQLRDWSYKEMLRRGFHPDSYTRELADNYAVEAIEDILQAEFTYDISYFAWLRLIVQRKCNQGARRSQTQKRGHNVQKVRLEELIESLEHPKTADPATTIEKKLDLEKAVTQLTEARRTLLRLRYQDGLSFQEVATNMGRKISAIYSLHFKALEQLKNILQQTNENN